MNYHDFCDVMNLDPASEEARHKYEENQRAQEKINASADFMANLVLAEEEGEDLLARYSPGEIIPYEAFEDLDDPAWHAIRVRVVEVPGEGYRLKDGDQ